MDLQLIPFSSVDLSDTFFDSLKQDYREFEEWFLRKAHELVYIHFDDDGTIDGFLYLKDETGPVTDVSPPLEAAARIKIGTFKIEAHGTKLGERFMKKIIDRAISTHVDDLYVTIFPQHEPLVKLFHKYGFVQSAIKLTGNGEELVLTKKIRSEYLNPVSSYPLIRLGDRPIHVLSIYPEWHTRLLPDSILRNEDIDIVQDVSHTNSIHKVYLTKMKGIDTLRSGDILLIYRTSDGLGPAHFRAVTTSICVVEEYRNISSFLDHTAFSEYCSPYSVFTEQELADYWQSKRYPHVIRFTYNVAFRRRPTRQVLIEEVRIPANEYWGFLQISKEQFLDVAMRGQVDASLIINQT